MPLDIIRADIATLKVDAIVNPTDSAFSGSGGTDKRIHEISGKPLRDCCDAMQPLRPGMVCATPAFGLPSLYIIHTVGPVWQGGSSGEDELLADCYYNALKLAMSLRCESVAFPIISAGSFGYPKDRALSIATDCIREFLFEHELQVYLVVYDNDIFRLSQELYSDVKQFIDECSLPSPALYMNSIPFPYAKECPIAEANPRYAAPFEELDFSLSLDDMLRDRDESFSEMLLRKIDERGMKDSDCYKRANIDRRVFSKIRNDPHYKTSKPTAVAFAIALELDMDETEELLRKAGFALSRSSVFDIIIEYFISKGKYDIFEINNVLYSFDQSILGSL